MNSRRKKTLTYVLAGVALAAASLALYMTLSPKKVEVRFGTIVRDPVDGHVWSDNTRTAYVPSKDAHNFKVEYVDKLSPEHEQQQAQARAEEEQQVQEAQSQGLEAVAAPVSSEQFAGIQNLQENIESAGASVISGLDMANEVQSTKSSLVDFRNQISSSPAPAELADLKGRLIRAFDLYINACDLYLQAIATADMSFVDKANGLIDQANSEVRALVPQ